MILSTEAIDMREINAGALIIQHLQKSRQEDILSKRMPSKRL